MGDLKTRFLEKQKDMNGMRPVSPFPKVIKIDICNKCNYACIFCPTSRQINKIGCIDDVLFRKIIKDAYFGGARELGVTMTGEPLLNPHLVEYISLARSIGYEYIFLNTNGYLMTIELAEKILKAGINSVKFSVNASEKSYEIIHGVDGYKKVINNIKNYYKLREKINKESGVYVSYIQTKQTVDEAAILKDELESYIDDFLVINFNNRGGQVDEHLGDLMDNLFLGDDEYSIKFPCSLLFNNAYITAEGYLLLCCQDFNNTMVVADLNKDSILDAWNNDKFVGFRRKYLEGNIKGTMCENCVNNTHYNVKPLSPEYRAYDISEQKVEFCKNRILKLIGR